MKTIFIAQKCRKGRKRYNDQRRLARKNGYKFSKRLEEAVDLLDEVIEREIYNERYENPIYHI